MLQTTTSPLLRWFCQDWGSVVWLACQVNFETAWSWMIGTDAYKKGQEYVSKCQYCLEVGEWEGVVLEMKGARQWLCYRCGCGRCELLERVGPRGPLGWCPWG